MYMYIVSKMYMYQYETACCCLLTIYTYIYIYGIYALVHYYHINKSTTHAIRYLRNNRMYLIIYVYAYMYIFIYTYIKTCHIEKIYVCVNLWQIIPVTCECVSTWICANSHYDDKILTKFILRHVVSLKTHFRYKLFFVLCLTELHKFRIFCLTELYSFRIRRDYLLVNFSFFFAFIYTIYPNFLIIHIMFSCFILFLFQAEIIFSFYLYLSF